MISEEKAKRADTKIVPGILVDRQIQEVMSRKMLNIDPFYPKFLEPATYDLGIGDVAVLSTAPEPIDLRQRPLLTLEPYAAALVQTDEILKLSGRIVGRLGPRSNLSRNGIFVSTGPQIDPGFEGRLFVNLLNMTERPFLIRYLTRFLSVEFHLLSREPSRHYKGPNQGKTELSEDEINRLLGRGGPSLKDIHRDLMEVHSLFKSASTLGEEIPRLFELQQKTLDRLSESGASLRFGSIIVPISTLEPAPYDLLRDIPCVLQPSDGGYVATFFDANIGSSGETQQEALENLKALLIDIYEDLESESVSRLGPEPKRQLQVLRAVLRKRTR